jgi:hypothetical protein
MFAYVHKKIFYDASKYLFTKLEEHNFVIKLHESKGPAPPKQFRMK